mmetsp:Transcript_65390/g.80049  ORF Transcript_65390/g.80049 Transcript_65390/m.80049 type:complete len:382 (-) Transcript_65390:16-1161(-)
MTAKALLKEIVPKLSISSHKGQAGRICIVGGCELYTGAPYFAGISALKAGADLATVICDKNASTAIKSYSPELIVEPKFDIMDGNENYVKEFNLWLKSDALKRFSAVVCGPGLGRNDGMLESVSKIIINVLKEGNPLVLDGDALYLISLPKYRDIISKYGSKGYNVILTPNAMEFRRLWINYILKKDINNYKKDANEYVPHFDDTTSLFKDIISNTDTLNTKIPPTNTILNVKDWNNIKCIQDTSQLSKLLNNITILRKGAIDLICNDNQFIILCKPYILRRCGGQGDILAGLCGLFLDWTLKYYTKSINNNSIDNESKDNTETNINNIGIISAFGGAYLLREFADEAFKTYKRSTLTSNMIDVIPSVMEREFPVTMKSFL